MNEELSWLINIVMFWKYGVFIVLRELLIVMLIKDFWLMKDEFEILLFWMIWVFLYVCNLGVILDLYFLF